MVINRACRQIDSVNIGFLALEIFWWLGYRNESFILANEARGFVSDEKTVERYHKLRLWDPATEYDHDLGDGTSHRTNKIEDFNEPEMEREIDLDPILGRPDGK